MYGNHEDYSGGVGGPGRHGGGFPDRGVARSQRRIDKRRRVFKRTRAQFKETPEQRIVQSLLILTETPSEEQNPGEALKDIDEHLRRFGETVTGCLIDCIVELPTKTHHYATLLGRLCSSHGEWVDAFLKAAIEAFETSLSESASLRSRMLMRFFMASTSAGIVSSASVLALVHSIVDSVLNVTQSTDDSTGRSWQPYTDCLISLTLLSLPWGGASIFESPNDWQTFVDKVETYVTHRPIQRDAASSPFLAAIRENDVAARSDSGGPSFVTDLWSAVQELRSTGWQCGSVPTIASRAAQIDRQRMLESVTVPTLPPGTVQEMSTAKKATMMHERYPPRGGLQLLEAQHTHPGAMEIDRIVIEQHIIDTLTTFHGSRVECVQRIARDIMAPFPICPLTAQTLFSQLLTLPAPPLKPVAYSAVIVHLCKVTDEKWNVFPRGLSACVREIFARMDVLDSELMGRMVDWLSLHLSNLGFMWPWTKWKRVIDAQEDDGQRQFVIRVLSNLVGLSDSKTNSPEEFHVLLPREETTKAFDILFALEEKEGEGEDPDQMDVDRVIAFDKDRNKLDRLRELVTSRQTADVIRDAFGSDIDGSADDVHSFAKGFFRVLFLCAVKNLTHAKTILDRYQSLIDDVSEKFGEVCGSLAIDAAMDVWEGCIARGRSMVELLMTRGTASPVVAIDWAFARLSTLSVDDSESRAACAILDAAVEFAESKMKEAQKTKDDAVDTLRQAQANAQEGADRAAEAAASLESGAVNVQEMIEKINEANRWEERARDEVVAAEAHLQSIDGTAMDTAKQLLSSVCNQTIRNYFVLLRALSEATDRSRFYYRSLARLGAFCRRQSAVVGAHVETVEGLMAAGDVDDQVRRVVLNSFRLGKDTDVTEAMYDAGALTKKREAV